MATEDLQTTADGEISPRVALNQAFWDASARKKANKPQKLGDGTWAGDVRQFLAASREIIAVRKKIRILPPEERQLTEPQLNVYVWAIQAVATKSNDLQEVREHAMLFAKIFDHRLKRGWRPDDFDKIGLASCLLAFAKRIDVASKSGEGNRKPISYEVAGDYLQLADQACEYLTAADFKRREITEADRRRLTKPGQKPLKMKAWQSNVEKIVGVAARCVKEHAPSTGRSLTPGPKLLDFVGRHLDAGPWFGYYYARWLMAAGRPEDAVEFMRKVVSAKRQEMWAWMAFAEMFLKAPTEARDCYCRALCCPIHDREISAAMAKKVHRRLEPILRSLGEVDAANAEAALAQSEQALPGQSDYYRQHARGADILLIDPAKSRSFEGAFMKREGQTFGFVRVGGYGRDSIFVPPPLAKKFADGARVKGHAVLQMDRKKNRESWTAEIIESCLLS